jgi:C-terminal processing protease CtpA/Prc
MMRAAGAVLVGQTSAGSSGRPTKFRLGNGVAVWLPSWIDVTPDGTGIEGYGVVPDVTAEVDPERPGDPVLEVALATLAARRPQNPDGAPGR